MIHVHIPSMDCPINTAVRFKNVRLQESYRISIKYMNTVNATESGAKLQPAFYQSAKDGIKIKQMMII
jgi:hypothetical protein